MSSVKVLSIDGGGIRGIIPAVVLAEIERRTDKPICELFDLITGTSAGGILALGLTMPGTDGKPKYKAEELITLFQQKGKKIFARSFARVLPFVRNIVGAKYSAKGIEGVLKEYFEEARLKDALTDVIITSYDIERRVPFFFKSKWVQERGPSYDYPMWQIARATSAAPTYFEPCRIEATDLSEYYALVDGGVFANNPAMCAYAEAMTRYISRDGSAQTNADDCLMVSLGTGELTRRVFYDQAEGFSDTLNKGWGLLKWAQPIISVVFDGVADSVHYQLEQLLPPSGGVRHYYRFQRLLQQGDDALDNASDKNVRNLRLVGRDIIDENSPKLDQLCKRLVT